ncbi:MAG: hypothetical protein HOO99_03235 [Hyphomicrobiaceae bacterium]|nr:hypothetical protein [Hyphomicrobiaceae bacterium]
MTNHPNRSSSGSRQLIGIHIASDYSQRLYKCADAFVVADTVVGHPVNGDPHTTTERVVTPAQAKYLLSTGGLKPPQHVQDARRHEQDWLPYWTELFGDELARTVFYSYPAN